MELIDSFIQLISTHQDYCFVIILLILIASGAGFPLSKDAFLIATGVIAALMQSANHYAIEQMLIICIVGVIIGDCIMFYLGRMLSYKIQHIWPFSKMLTPKRFAKLRKYYKHYGIWFILIARFTPIIRIPLYLFCGMSRKIKISLFMLINGIATTFYTSIWVMLGFICASQRELILSYITQIQILFALIVASLIIGLILKKRKFSKHHKST